VTETRIEATHQVGLFRWIQYLKVSDAEGTRCFDEGNGEVLRRQLAQLSAPNGLAGVQELQ
jgi:hypothetical protein